MKMSKIKTNMNAVLSWLCCKKRRYDNLENTDMEVEKVSATKSANTGQGGCQPTDSQPQVGKMEKEEKKEPPWLIKYFQTATYHPGHFYSDTEEEEEDDDENNDDLFKSEEVELPKDEIINIVDEIFEFPFHDSTFRFPHTDYDEVGETRRPAKTVPPFKILKIYSRRYFHNIGCFSFFREFYRRFFFVKNTILA